MPVLLSGHILVFTLNFTFEEAEALQDYPNCLRSYAKWGFPGGSDGKESAYHVEDPGSIPGSGRSPGEENGYPLQYSCLESSMDRGAWQATVHGVAKRWSQMSD